MEIHFSSNLCAQLPNLKVGVIHYNNMIVEDSPQMLKGRLQLFQESLFFDLEDKNINDLPEIQEWRSIFKQLGKNPSRYRHSAESLYRRIQKENFLPSMNSAADINNFFSLKYRIPIGIYDLEKITGNVELRVGEADDQYEGLNGRMNQMENFLITADDDGAFGSPFVDSTRTAVSLSTKNALQIVYLPQTLNEKEANDLLGSLFSMFTQINGGEGYYKVQMCS